MLLESVHICVEFTAEEMQQRQAETQAAADSAAASSAAPAPLSETIKTRGAGSWQASG